MPTVPPYIASLQPYVPGKPIEEVEREYGVSGVAKLADMGIIFGSFSDAVKEHPDLVRKYLGSVVPYTDNFFAALNAAVLGPVPGWTNIHVATGYGAHGLLLSPYCGRLAAVVGPACVENLHGLFGNKFREVRT